MSEPGPALAAYRRLRLTVRAPITQGLINQTYLVEGVGGRYVLQRVNGIFDPAIHDNIAAVTRHLREHGLVTPELVLTDDGRAWVEADGCWRILTFVEGTAHDRASSPDQLEAAGRLVGRFHAALESLEHTFVGMRVGVHDTPAHLARLREALDGCRDHPLYDEVAPLGQGILAAAEALPTLPPVEDQPCHGDLKLSNLLFMGGEAVCLIDLDTLGPMALSHELGDALRSWCNPKREDEAGPARFDVSFMAAAWRGYVQGLGRAPSGAEREAARIGVEHVCLELSARFAADALRESYFGWDPARYATRGHHNLVRAQGQWSLYEAVVGCRAEREASL